MASEKKIEPKSAETAGKTGAANDPARRLVPRKVSRKTAKKK